ncbi:Organic cation/carnitine transporter 4 [Acorus calamus]|uniref:H(+)/Pi cotransporter n=1 Tax=Acorus calamus TaxID=4465 RepID=A0AAV9FKW4_ACOCL|nr:Organic cation/carnitine transporter 4 [Acorus calamus]
MDGPDLETPLARDALDGGEGEEGIGIDEMLERHAGEFGPWQLWHFVLTSLAWLIKAFHTMACVGPGCRPGPELGGVCRLEPGSWEWVGGPGGSTVSKFGLVCGDKYKVGLAQFAFFAGCMFGAGVFGHLSDSFLGRKGFLTTVCILCAIFSCLTALSPSYWAYALLRFLTGLSAGGVGLCAFVLATEPIGPQGGSGGGLGPGPPQAQAINHIHICIGPPLVRGRTKDAMRVIHSVAARNGKRIPDGVSLILDDDNNDNKQESGNAVSGSLIDVMRSPVTRGRLILTVVINFMTAIVYYGLNLNVVNLGTNVYVNVALNAVAEMPAFADCGAAEPAREEAHGDRDDVVQWGVLFVGELVEQ